MRISRSTLDRPPAVDAGREARHRAVLGMQDIVHAFGHGHVGLAAGPVTGRLAADLAGRPRRRGIDLRPVRRNPLCADLPQVHLKTFTST